MQKMYNMYTNFDLKKVLYQNFDAPDLSKSHAEFENGALMLKWMVVQNWIGKAMYVFRTQTTTLYNMQNKQNTWNVPET